MTEKTEVVAQVVNRRDELVTVRRTGTLKQLQTWLDKQDEKGVLVKVLAWAE